MVVTIPDGVGMGADGVGMGADGVGMGADGVGMGAADGVGMGATVVVTIPDGVGVGATVVVTNVSVTGSARAGTIPPLTAVNEIAAPETSATATPRPRQVWSEVRIVAS